MSALVVAVAACGGSDEAPADTGPMVTDIDACSLLTPSQISSATGLTWGSGTTNTSLSVAGRSVCDWHTAGSEYAAVQVMVVSDASSFEANKASASEVFGLSPGGVSIGGADDAYATSEGSLIAMRIGNHFVQVSYIPPGPGNVLSNTMSLAQNVAAGL
jgi:hypothetical protein